MKWLFLSLLSIFLLNCSGSHQENIAKLDKIYGKCNNPLTENTLTQYEKVVCQDKQRAAGPDGVVGEPKTINDIINDIVNKNDEGKIVAYSAVNNSLWQGALKTFENYPIKNADFEGGYLETDWIYDSPPIERCLIKARIKTAELISNGIETKIICQSKMEDVWINQDKLFVGEEKKLTLKILENANEHKSLNQN
jgi:hypothetical protein